MEFKNIGPIKQGSVDLSDMTIFFGKNGTGKTYISYVIFGILSFLSDKVSIFLNDGEIQKITKEKRITLNYDETIERMKGAILKDVKANMHDILKRSFNRSDKEVSNFEVTFKDEDFEKLNYFKRKEDFGDNYTFQNFSRYVIQDVEGISKEKVYDVVVGFELAENQLSISLVEKSSGKDVFEEKYLRPRPMSTIQGSEELLVTLNRILSSTLKNLRDSVYIPAERIGINVFLKEINKNRLSAYDKIVENASDVSYIKGKLDAYPSPISSYLSNLNGWKDFYEIIFNKKNPFAANELEDAREILTSKLLRGKLTIDSEKDEFRYISNNTQDEIPLQISSSSIKSLVGLELYLQTVANVGDYLIIDEPELNLHPEAQKDLAMVLEGLVEIGLKVVISTHSDYLIRELVNIELEKKINADLNETNFSKKTLAYDFIDGSINQISNLQEQQTIGNFDEVTDDIENKYYTLLDKYQEILEEKKK